MGPDFYLGSVYTVTLLRPLSDTISPTITVAFANIIFPI